MDLKAASHVTLDTCITPSSRIFFVACRNADSRVMFLRLHVFSLQANLREQRCEMRVSRNVWVRRTCLSAGVASVVIECVGQSAPPLYPRSISKSVFITAPPH